MLQVTQCSRSNLDGIWMHFYLYHHNKSYIYLLLLIELKKVTNSSLDLHVHQDNFIYLFFVFFCFAIPVSYNLLNMLFYLKCEFVCFLASVSFLRLVHQKCNFVLEIYSCTLFIMWGSTADINSTGTKYIITILQCLTLK